MRAAQAAGFGARGKRPRWAKWHRCARFHVLIFSENDPISLRLLFVTGTAYPVNRGTALPNPVRTNRCHSNAAARAWQQ